MNHELVKKLKDAGFPLRVIKYYRENTPTCCEIFSDEKGVLYYVPTLSELIEACGKNFFCLVRREDDGKPFGDDGFSYWFAYKADDKMNGIAYISPEEAVANLWLELNKK